MTTRQAPADSPDVLFDVPSISSPELSFSTPHATSNDLHEDSKTTTHVIDEGERASQNGTNVDILEENADKPSSNEVDGLQSVNLTPTSPSSHATYTNADALPETDETNERRRSSPPIVLKSAPGTPTAEPTRLNDLADTPSPHDSTPVPHPNVKAPSNGAEEIFDDPVPDPNVKAPSDGADEALDDPRALVISSLRTQISDLFSQVNLLNSKLVQSYDRVSTLEETLDDNTERLRALDGERMNLEREKSVLEMERAKQEQMVKDGRLVERSAVAAELNRLMEESLASSSAKQSAEAKHKQMESELSDLSANLFSTANEMVATERQARAKVEETLVSTRATVSALERQLGAAKIEKSREENEKEALREAKLRTEYEMQELRKALRGVNSSDVVSLGSGGVLRIMNSHLPFKNEYLGFLAHLRGLAGSSPDIPGITSLLTLPFLARLAVEDSEPTLRLDLAPSLNWLTRRSVLAAVHSNTLLIEQIHVATLFLEGSSSSYSYAGFGSGSSLPTSPTQLTKVNCALCGKIVYMSPEAIQAEENRRQSIVLTDSPTTPTPNSIQTSTITPIPQRSVSGGWAASKFLKSVTLPSLGGVVAGATGSRSNSPTPRHSSLDSSTYMGSVPGTPTTPVLERPSSPPPPTSLQTVIHAFRVPLSNKSANTSTTNLLTADPSQPSENYGPPYPLCHTGWCLARLRTTCELWGCVRTDVLERVWKDGIAERRRVGSGSSVGTDGVGRVEKVLPPIGSDSNPAPDAMGSTTPPPVPSKRKMPNLWGMGKDVLDKAKAYGNASPGSEGPSMASPASTTAGTSRFFGGVQRSFSGGAVMANSTTPTEPIRDRSSSESSEQGVDPMGTVKAPPLPKRNMSRLSAVFTGPEQPADNTMMDSGEVREVVGLESEVVEAVHDGPLVLPETKPEEASQSTEPTLAPSASVDAFVTPSETPMQELSPNPDAQGTKDSASAEALTTAISDHISKSEGEGASEEPEPPTPTSNSAGFSTSQAAEPDTAVPSNVKSSPPARTGHARNTSIASIISEGRGAKTSRPTTPVKRPGSGVKAGSRPETPSKGTTASGSRPSTPSKIATLGPKPEKPPTKAGPISPPPVPRRAAARNAARTSVAISPKQDGKQGEVTSRGVEAVAGGSGDVSKDGDAGEEKSGNGQQEEEQHVENVAKEGVEAPPTGNESAPAHEESPQLGDTTMVPGDSPNDTEAATPALDVAPPTPSSADKDDAGRREVLGDHLLANEASATSTPRSLSAPLPEFEPPSPTSQPVPPFTTSLEGADTTPARPREPSVISASSAYSPSVYTTNSGVNGPTAGAAGEGNAESEQKNGRHEREYVKFYVGRETWEERAWLKLVQIRESMFWARLGGVRY